MKNTVRMIMSLALAAGLAGASSGAANAVELELGPGAYLKAMQEPKLRLAKETGEAAPAPSRSQRLMLDAGGQASLRNAQDEATVIYVERGRVESDGVSFLPGQFIDMGGSETVSFRNDGKTPSVVVLISNLAGAE